MQVSRGDGSGVSGLPINLSGGATLSDATSSDGCVLWGFLPGRSGYYDGKDYRHDSKFRYRSPPHFPDPVQAQWRVQTFSEQMPAR